MQSINIKTVSPSILHIIVLALGGVSAVAALVWIIVFLIRLTVEGLALISSFLTQANALLSSMPALHFFALLVFACVLTVGSVKVVLWAVRSVRLEVKNYVI